MKGPKHENGCAINEFLDRVWIGLNSPNKLGLDSGPALCYNGLADRGGGNFPPQNTET